MKTLVNIAAPLEQSNILLTSAINESDTSFKNAKEIDRFSKNGSPTRLQYLT